jgi:hypothetical protein
MDNPTRATVPAFTYPTVPASQTQTDRQRAIGLQAQIFANALIENCPQGDELDCAISSLRVATMWANQAIATTGAARGQAG